MSAKAGGQAAAAGRSREEMRPPGKEPSAWPDRLQAVTTPTPSVARNHITLPPADAGDSERLDDTMNTKENLAALAREARAIAQKALDENRDFTAEEQTQINGKLNEMKELREDIGAAVKSAAILGQLDAMAAGASGVIGGHRLAFTQSTAAGMAKAILGDSNFGVKALAPSGSAVVAQEFSPDPVALGQPANSLLAVLPVKTHATAQFSYLRQTTRTNNAAVVAEGAVKPTSVYSVTQIEDHLDVVAHLSEGVPRYWFADNDALQQFLINELQYGLAVAVEAMALADIDGTSGIQTNAYATSPLVTIRKSLTKLEAQGYNAAAIVVHPNDWEATELLVSSTNAVEHLSLPFDPVARRLYGVPIVVTNVQTQGVAHTLAQGAAGLDTDGRGIGVQWSETSNADDFSKNLIRARCEGRFATSVYSPLGIVKSDLTA